jgi:hypothetical protein
MMVLLSVGDVLKGKARFMPGKTAESGEQHLQFAGI